VTWVERHWQRITPLSAALYPVSLVFRAFAALRRAAYRKGLLRVTRLRAPVVIVGNITVGGTGKTPLVLWLAGFLREKGLHPGIVSRGYGVPAAEPRAVAAAASAAQTGDEPLLLAQRSRSPVWIGANRVAAAQALLAAHPACDVIVSDDGLQHYALARDVEIAVVDGARGLGNGLLLPAGPLREPPSRLRTVDAVVVHGTPAAQAPAGLALSLEGAEFHNLLNPEHVVGPGHFQRRRVHAVAGIGNPARFFSHLEALGLGFQAHAFADHHRYSAADLAFADCDAVVMTEKDAVKCAPFAHETHWALRVDARPDPELGELILRKLKARR
jgi:tetraacyldisaccharide 4'-kinase